MIVEGTGMPYLEPDFQPLEAVHAITNTVPAVIARPKIRRPGFIFFAAVSAMTVVIFGFEKPDYYDNPDIKVIKAFGKNKSELITAMNALIISTPLVTCFVGAPHITIDSINHMAGFA